MVVDSIESSYSTKIVPENDMVEEERVSHDTVGNENMKIFSASSAAVHAVEQAGNHSSDLTLETVIPERPRNVKKIDNEECHVDGIDSMELTVNPVTRIASEYSESMNCTVAVNDDFISYGLKQGHIRVLHRYSSARALLKGHTGPVACMCFLSSDVVAAGGMDGKLFVWKVAATEDENALKVDLIMSAVFSPGCDTSKVIVSPVPDVLLDGDDQVQCMVVAVGHAVILVKVGTGELDIDPLNPAPYGSRLDDFPLQDEPSSLSISPQGVLAVGSMRGRVYVCNLRREGGEVVADKLTPMTMGEAIDGVDWVNNATLMVSTQEGRCKRLYCNQEDGLQFADMVVLSQESGSPPYVHTCCVMEQHVACLADTRNKSVYLLTFKDLKGSRPGFNSLAKFSVGQAILSMSTCWNQDAAEEGKGGIELNCVQTDAVQQYYIDIDLFADTEDEPAEEDSGDQRTDAVDETYTKEEDVEEEVGAGTLEKLRLDDSNDSGDQVMLTGRLLTPSDIISSSQNDKPLESNDSSSQIKILKRGEKIKSAPKATEEAKEESSDEESDEESPGLQSVPLALLDDSSVSSMYTMLAKLIKENSTKQNTMIKKAFKDQKKYVDDQMTKMTKSLDKKFTAQIKSEMKAFQSSINSTVQNAAKESIRTILPKEVMGAVKTSLDKQLSGAVQQGLHKSIQDSFKNSFTKQIVPAFESACQTMFRQLDESLTRGIQEYADASRSSLEHPMELARTLQTTLESAQVFADNISHSHQFSGEAGLSSSTSGLRSPKHQDPKEELQNLIQLGKYNDAFSKVLSLQDLKTLSWLCSIVDAPSTLAISPPVFSQMVLLSMLQQLSADLSHGMTSKLQWIREAAMAINPADQSIKAHIKPVLEQVARALQTSLPGLSPADASSCKLTLHVVRSQMQM